MTHRRNYQNGKVYAISNSHDDKIYVGATCTSLERRLCSHRTKSRNDAGSLMTLYQHMRLHGEDNYFITLLEDVPCSDARTLHAREGHWIGEMGTLNRRISGRTLAQYYMDNQQSIIDKVNAYALKNREQTTNQDKMRLRRGLHFPGEGAAFENETPSGPHGFHRANVFFVIENPAKTNKYKRPKLIN